MKNQIEIFKNKVFGEIRTVTIDGEPWFVGTDVATALGYSNTRDALATHVDDDDKNTVAIHDGIPGNPNRTIINESGVYSLIFGSQLESAKQFKRWVTHDVLPAIRKKGYYSAIPDEQLTELLIANMNDSDRLEHVVIPAMRDADVEQIELVASYMGLDPKDISSKMFRSSDTNRRAKRTISEWHRYGRGDYTVSDLSEPYNTHPLGAYAIDTVRHRKGAYGHFAEYCGTIHFDRDGYILLIDWMRKRKYITPEQADSWSMDVMGIRQDVR